MCRAGPGVKNFVRERRRESCRERSLAYKRKHLGNKKIERAEDDTGINKYIYLCTRNVNNYDNISFLYIFWLDEKAVPLGPKVSDFIDLTFWKRKQICCGTIFVNSFGEAILDPRFIKKCKNHNAGQTSNLIQKRQTPLTKSLSFEQIIRKELEDVKEAEKISKIPDLKEKRDSEGCYPKMSSVIDQDEGFFDRSSSSPCSDENITQSLDVSD